MRQWASVGIQERLHPQLVSLPRSSGAAVARFTRKVRVAPMLSDAMTGRFPRGVIRSAQTARSFSPLQQTGIAEGIRQQAKMSPEAALTMPPAASKY